jgi:hypothetical protein
MFTTSALAPARVCFLESPTNGHISDNCYRAPAAGGGAGGQAMNRRGPFGDYRSDGQCSFVNGVPVGRC